MNYVKNHPKTIAAIVVLGVLLILAVVFAPKPTGPTTAAATTITSPYAKTTIDLPVNTGLAGDANTAAVSGQYEIFGLGKLPISADLSYAIHEDLPSQIAKLIHPTYAHTYIHIDLNTLKCETDFECEFSFYLDSPEGYYHYRHYSKDDGSIGSTLTQQPFSEVRS